MLGWLVLVAALKDRQGEECMLADGLVLSKKGGRLIQGMHRHPHRNDAKTRGIID